MTTIQQKARQATRSTRGLQDIGVPELTDTERALVATAASSVLAQRFGSHSEIWRNGHIHQAHVHPNLLTADFSIDVEGFYLQITMDYADGSNTVRAYDKRSYTLAHDYRRVSLGDLPALVRQRRTERVKKQARREGILA